MRYNKIIFQITLLAIVLFSVSCSKQPKKELLTQSIWKFDQITSPSSDPNVLSVLERNKGFLKDQELKFNIDSTFTSTFPPTADGSRNESGDWIMDKDKPILTLYTYETRVIWDIETLDENTLEIKRTDPSLKVDLYYQYSKK